MAVYDETRLCRVNGRAQYCVSGCKDRMGWFCLHHSTTTATTITMMTVIAASKPVLATKAVASPKAPATSVSMPFAPRPVVRRWQMSSRCVCQHDRGVPGGYDGEHC